MQDISTLARLVFAENHLPGVFWALHTSANLSALGTKARPVACGDVLRRVISGTFCREYGKQLAAHFEPWAQYGVSSSGGVETMALRATMAFQEGCTVLSYDGENAFNSMYRASILPALAEIVPMAVPYMSNVYARGTSPKLLFSMDDGRVEVVESSRGVQQGCNMGSLCYSAGALKILKAFRQSPPVQGAEIMSFIDDIVVLLPCEHAGNMMAVSAVTEWLQERMKSDGISLNRSKSKVLLPTGLKVSDLGPSERTILESTELVVAEGGINVVGVPVGSEDYQRRHVSETMNGEPAELLRALTEMEDTQASFQILRLSAATRMNFLLRTLPPHITRTAAKEFDTLVEWALASIIGGQKASEEGLASSKEVEQHPVAATRQTVLTEDAIRQARLPMREGGYGLGSAVDISGPAFVGCNALVLAKAVAASSEPRLQVRMEQLPDLPVAKALVHELREITSYATGKEVVDMVGALWAALALGKDPANRGKGVLLLEAGNKRQRNGLSGNAWGGRGDTGRDEEGDEGNITQGGGGSEGSSHEGDGLDIPGLGEMPSRGAQNLGVVRQAQSRVSRALFKKKAQVLLSDLRAKATTMSGKRALVRYQGARGRGAMAWVACQGVSHWDRMDPEMYRETLARGLGSHDVERPIGTRCHAGCEQEASYTHSLICTRGGMQTHTHDAILHRFLVRALKDCRIAHGVAIEAPFKEGTGNGDGNYRMDVVTGYGALLRERETPVCIVNAYSGCDRH